MEELTNNRHKMGLTKIDIIHILIIIIMIIVYIILLSQSPSITIPTKKNITNDDDNDDSNVSNLDIIISVWGFILGLFVSSFVTRFVFREYSSNISIIVITFIFSIILLIFFYIGTNYQNKHIDSNWVRYNQVIFPLIGGLFLISEDAINHLFDYFGGNKDKYSGGFNFDKFAGSLIEVRNALAKNNILSETSTDYKGSSSSIISDYFTSD